MRGTAMAGAAVIALLLVGCGGSSSSTPTSLFPDTTEPSRAAFVGQLADYFGWSHQSQYNDIWKIPCRTFADVSVTDTYGKEIECAYEENVIAPDANGNFNPNLAVTREDAAVILATAFYLPLPSDNSALSTFTDASSISTAAQPYVAALVKAGFMPGRTSTTFGPTEAITTAEVNTVYSNIQANMCSVIQAMPKQTPTYLTMLPEFAGNGTVTATAATVTQMLADKDYAPRRFIDMTSATTGATVYYTTDGSDPTSSSTRLVYDVNVTGHIQELVGQRSGAFGPEPYRSVVYKAVAVKDGLLPSPVRTFHWNLYRPWTSVYQTTVVEAGNFDPTKGTITPKVTRVCNDYESVRPMSWVIEGPGGVLVMDALQTVYNDPNQTNGTLFDTVKSVVTAGKPITLVVGHAHVDHYAQTQNFLTGGATVYANSRSWASLAAQLASVDNIKQVNNIDIGSSISIGTAAVPMTFNVYAAPGHENSLVMLHDPVSGYLFATDFFGCTRMGTADNVNISGARMDLVLSAVQQIEHKMTSNGGQLTTLFTGHDESPLPGSHVDLFRSVLQKVVDEQEDACQVTNRGCDMPMTRMAGTGNMFTDLYDWAAFDVGGTYGQTPYVFLSDPGTIYDPLSSVTQNTVNYQTAGNNRKYAQLGNIEFGNATLVGTTLTWAAPNAQVTLSDSSLYPASPVPNSYSNMFNPWVYTYTVDVASASPTITIAPVPLSSKVSAITVNGTVYTVGSPISLTVTNGQQIPIIVTSADGTTTGTYTLTVAFTS
jgi:glyoxylase-like metal-dependent hydrolase (beta-lactamase superfamily II)